MIKDRLFDWTLRVYDENDILISDRVVYPIFPDSLSLTGEKDDENFFMRYIIDGSLSFVGNDFDYITSFGIENGFKIIMYWYASTGTRIFNYSFFKTDCSFNYDDRKVDVNVHSTDQYEEIINNLSNEYNVINLAPAITPIEIILRPIWQFLWVDNGAPFGGKITNMIGGLYWESDILIDDFDKDVLQTTYKFRLITDNGNDQFYARQLYPKGNSFVNVERPVNDITQYSRLYPYAGGAIINAWHINSNTTTTPTKWGADANGNYFLPPTQSLPGPNYFYFPVFRSQWENASIWVSLIDTYYEPETAKLRIRHTYNISEVISKLLSKVAPDITHDSTPAYSLFLYGTNPISTSFRQYLAPKSNVINADYQTAATKGIISLDIIFKYLRDVYKCYWFIDELNRLRIEHISYFINGYSYQTVENIGVDLTNLYNTHTNNPLSFGQNSISYDVESLPKRIELSYPEDCSDIFKLSTIQVLSKYVKGDKEEININNISGDVDFAISSGTNNNLDGWIMLCPPAGYTALNFYEFTNDTSTNYPIRYRIQNVYVSMYYATRNYHLHDLPSYKVLIDEIFTPTVKGVKRAKKQNAIIPKASNINDRLFVKTDIGNGLIENLSINLSSEVAECELSFKID